MKIHTIDLEHLGLPGRIASYLIPGPQGPILIETGPSSCHQALVRGLATHGVEPRDVRHVFLTHIHLDHAGAAGWWAAQGATIHVHEIGAPHLIDPSRLISSAARLYGARMDVLWGEIPPVPREKVRVVEDGEVVSVSGLEVRAVATPGHASHHHAYVLDDIACTGDLAAIVIPDTGLVEIPTPPPEYDLELWRASLDKLDRLGLAAIYPTHFGRVDHVGEHFETVRRLLGEATHLVRRSIESGADKTAADAKFESWTRNRLLSDGASQSLVEEILAFNPPSLSVAGILRYWKQRAVESPSSGREAGSER